MFNNGCLADIGDRAPNLLVGGGTPAKRIAIENNYTFHTDLAGTSVQLGYASPNDDLVLRDNYLAGFVRMLPWDRVTARGNTFVGLTSLVELRATDAATLRKYDWNENTYLSGEVQYTPLTAIAGPGDVASGWQEWQEKAGLDRGGKYIAGRPTGKAVFVRPNPHQAGRANVIVYNWDRAESVAVNLTEVLKPGQKFKIVSAQNFFGEPIVRGTFAGQPITLPMHPTPRVQPVGMPDYALPATEPEFGAFVVLGE
jgi:hypothetical protein